MGADSTTLASPRLRALAQEGPLRRAVEAERCDLCGASVPETHRHLVDLETRRLMCACRACALLFDRSAAGGRRYRLVPDRRLRLERFACSDEAWERLQIPVAMAFFFSNSRAGKTMAFYPGPMGATESRLELSIWEQLERDNPILRTMQPDVEALLVDRARGAPRHWLVPIEDCYRLVAVIRTNWRGLTGGREVWARIEQFFDELDGRCRPEPQERSS